MFIAALFTIVKNWKQSGCLSIGEWLSNHGMSLSWYGDPHGTSDSNKDYSKPKTFEIQQMQKKVFLTD